MAKGIIYITVTSVKGLIKIGKCQSNRFEGRMYDLENNGYWNVSGLKRYYAVEVDDYDEKEALIHTIFSKSQVANSELFALDVKLAKEMLDAFEGRQIYPQSKKESVKEFYFSRTVNGVNTNARMVIENGKYIVKAGSVISLVANNSIKFKERDEHFVLHPNDPVTHKDFLFKTPSGAGCFVCGNTCNGWVEWKDKKGNSLNDYRENIFNQANN